jgi:DNA repair protein RadA/Sms
MKNRFGTTSEIGVFEMQQEGLKEITNPSQVFLEDSNYNSEGSVAIGLMEGSRPILVEIQALVSKTNLPMPRRTAVGIDNARLNLILAVLEKKLGAPFFLYDVYVNVVGGLTMDGTYGDLGLALALYSSLKGKSFKLDKTLVVGEIGLIGEVRPIAFCDRLVNEGIKMGFENFIIPQRNKEKMQNIKGNIVGVDILMDAVKSVF